MNQVTFLKKDAVVELSIGAGFLVKLQQLAAHLVSGLSQEDLDRYLREAEHPSEEFSEPWMEHLQTVNLLIYAVEKKAIDTNMVVTRNVEDMSELMSSGS